MHTVSSKGRISLSLPLKQACALLSLFLLLSILLNACAGETKAATPQQMLQNKDTLDQFINQAQSVGVPQTLLQPIINQENQLSTTPTPLTFLSFQPLNEYYHNIAQRYYLLSIQVKGLESQITQQFSSQAILDIQNFESALSQRQNQGFLETQAFADQLTQDQNLLAQASYPKHFLEVSNNARNATLALHLMGPVSAQLTTLHTTIKQLADAGLDVAALQQQEQNDLDIFHQANDPDDYQQLTEQINTQLQALTTLSTQAIPYVGTAKLNQFKINLELMQRYKIDTTLYQQQLTTDRIALANARSITDYLKTSAQIDNDIQAATIPMLKAEATYLLKNYYQEVSIWGTSNRYHDLFDGGSYILDYEYDATHGFGSELNTALQSAQTANDYQNAIDRINAMFLHLQAMETDTRDTTSYQLPHKSDLQLISHYKLTGDSIIVVSLVEQALRFYQNGKLVKAFHVTTGQYDRPTPPGLWQIFVRQSPTIFTSWDPKGSAFWYPDTNINYAMEYRSDGYYFHDSWWRLDYGPGTNFPHIDHGGDQAFAGSGSHGCINMPKSLANWLYQNTTYGTSAIIY